MGQAIAQHAPADKTHYMILRPAQPADAAALAELGRGSFCAAFAHLYAPGDLNRFLQEVYSVEVVSAEIADPACTYRLAEDAEGAGLTGYAKLIDPSPYAEHSTASRAIALGQLYCDPARIGEGIGTALLEWALEEAQGRGKDAVQLSVWNANYGAQRFYQRYGFARIADIHFMVGTHRDDEFLYELRL